MDAIISGASELSSLLVPIGVPVVRTIVPSRRGMSVHEALAVRLEVRGWRMMNLDCPLLLHGV